MIDRLFTAALAFAVLTGGTAAIGSDLWRTSRATTAPATPVVQLERVVVTGRRVPASAPLASAGTTQPAVQRLQ